MEKENQDTYDEYEQLNKVVGAGKIELVLAGIWTTTISTFIFPVQFLPELKSIY